MSFDYTKSAATATRLLTNFGRSVTHTFTLGEPVYDVETGSYTTPTETQTGVGVLLEYSTQEMGEHERAGTLVNATDRKLLLSVQGISVAPKNGDTIDWAGTAYTVKQAATLAPSGVAVMHEVMVTR